MTSPKKKANRLNKIFKNQELACSPTTFNTGTRLTWIKQKFSEPEKKGYKKKNISLSLDILSELPLLYLNEHIHTKTISYQHDTRTAQELQ